MGFAARTADPRVFERVVDYFHGRFQEEIKLESLNLRDLKFDAQAGLRHLADLRRMDISLRDITSSFHVPRTRKSSLRKMRLSPSWTWQRLTWNWVTRTAPGAFSTRCWRQETSSNAVRRRI